MNLVGLAERLTNSYPHDWTAEEDSVSELPVHWH